MGKAYFDCHCMISEPAKWVKELAKSGANMMTFHYESTIRILKNNNSKYERFM